MKNILNDSESENYPYSTKVMTKNTKKQKMQKTKTSVFVQNRRKKEMEIEK